MLSSFSRLTLFLFQTPPDRASLHPNGRHWCLLGWKQFGKFHQPGTGSIIFTCNSFRSVLHTSSSICFIYKEKHWTSSRDMLGRVQSKWCCAKLYGKNLVIDIFKLRWMILSRPLSGGGKWQVCSWIPATFCQEWQKIFESCKDF